MFLLVAAHPGSHRQRAIKRLLLLFVVFHADLFWSVKNTVKILESVQKVLGFFVSSALLTISVVTVLFIMDRHHEFIAC